MSAINGINAINKKRILAVVLALVAPALFGSVGLALAQPRPKPPAGKPLKPPPPTKPDAQAPEDTAQGNATTDGGKSGSAAESLPAPPPDPGDGGSRGSPLNPQPQELPSGATIDGGTGFVDYDRLLAEIAALRARVAAVADNLYQSRIAVALQLDGDRVKVGRLNVSLDDGVVYTAPPTFAASDMTLIYDHAVAPGRHAVTVDVERKDTRDEAFRTSQRSRFTVEVPRDHRVGVEVKIADESSMGADFASDRSGRYDLRFRVKVVAKPAGK
jgi:hypothetical protein